MARLVIEFTSASPDPMRINTIERGDRCRLEIIDLATTEDGVSGAAAGEENVIDLFAEAACWVQIGEDPEAVAEGENCRFLNEGERRQFEVSPGQRVAAIAE
jgi:hypothetical protein